MLVKAKEGGRTSSSSVTRTICGLRDVMTRHIVLAKALVGNINLRSPDIQVTIGAFITDMNHPNHPIKTVSGALRAFERELDKLERLNEAVRLDESAIRTSVQRAADLYVAIQHFSVHTIEVYAQITGLPQNTSYEYKTREEALFAKGEGHTHQVSHTDINQGDLGDCYLLAAIAAAAKTDPQRLKDMITDHGDGTYTVRFAEKTIKVDNRLPTAEGGNLAYASWGKDSPELWVAIIEKAYAKMQGGYEGQTYLWQGSESSLPSIAWEQLFGAQTGFHPLPRLLDYIMVPKKYSQAVCTESKIWSLLQQGKTNGWPMAFTDTTHAYAVIRVERPIVWLWDPHGHEKPVDWGEILENFTGFYTAQM
jgi:Calpain family cysteine protease